MTGEGIQNDGAAPASRQMLTMNEMAWIEFLRLISCDRDPPPTLRAIQALRRALECLSGADECSGDHDQP